MENKVNSLLTEVDDLYLGDKTGASVGTVVGISLSLAGLALTTSNIASQKYNCGVLATVSAECSKTKKAC